MNETTSGSGSGLRWAVRLAVVLGVAALAFVWGALMVHQRIFPYDLVRATLGPKQDRQAELARLEAHRQWANKVVAGGYILHFRHGQREKWNDVTAFDVYEMREKIDAANSSFTRATCLTQQGVEESKLIGYAFSTTGVGVSKVVASPSCRARQTAELAFGRVDALDNSLLHLTAVMPAQQPVFAAELRKLMLSLEPGPGQNVVLVGHINTLKYGDVAAIDVDNTGDVEAREETGFVVIEKIDGRLVVQHRFDSIKDFMHAIVELPLD